MGVFFEKSSSQSKIQRILIIYILRYRITRWHKQLLATFILVQYNCELLLQSQQVCFASKTHPVYLPSN